MTRGSTPVRLPYLYPVTQGEQVDEVKLQPVVTPPREGIGTPALPPLGNILAVGAGGAIGAPLRYAFNAAFPLVPVTLPLTTLAENILGAFLLGLILTLLLAHGPRMWDLRPFLTIGLLGSFTTFSAVSLEIVALGNGGALLLLLAYATLSLLLGFGAALAGMRLGRAFAPPRR